MQITSNDILTYGLYFKKTFGIDFISFLLKVGYSWIFYIKLCFIFFGKQKTTFETVEMVEYVWSDNSIAFWAQFCSRLLKI